MVSDLQSYCDLLLLDTTLGKNTYSLPLAFAVAVDSKGLSRLVMAASIFSESGSHFKWIMNCMKSNIEEVRPLHDVGTVFT